MKKTGAKQSKAGNHLSKKNIVSKKTTQKSYFNLFGVIIIILLGTIIYSNSFTCAFQFDDFPNIVDNTAIHDLSNVKAWWNFYPTRPVAVFSFALNYHFYRLDIHYWHLVNLIIHIINACIVGWLTLLIFSGPVMKKNPLSVHKKGLALLVALLFLSHPLATQSVTYIVQRMASMAALFYMLSLVFYAKARLTKKGNGTKHLLFAGCCLSALLAFFTKENTYTLPLAILLFEFFFLREKKFSVNLKDYRLYLFIAAGIGLLCILLFTFTFSIFDDITPRHGQTYTLTAWSYLMTQFSVIVKYIQLLLLPINQTLDYDFPISDHFFQPRTFLSFLFLLALMVAAVLLFKKHRLISFGIAWFFLTLSVESSFIPIDDVIFEHRTYLPSFGFFLVMGSGVFTLLKSNYRKLGIALLVAVILINSYLTYQRNKVWKDDLTLWNDEVSKSTNKARPNRTRGNAYLNRNLFEKSIDDFSKAIDINPNYSDAYNYRGFAYQNLNQLDNALADLSKAIELDPEYADACYNRGNVYANLGQWDKALSDYTQTIKINPKYVGAYSNRGFAYGNLGQWDKALTDFTSAIQLNPDDPKTLNNRGYAYNKLGEFDLAIKDFSTSIKIDPQNANSYLKRGNLYIEMQQWKLAIADYSKVLELDPQNEKARTELDIARKNLQSQPVKP